MKTPILQRLCGCPGCSSLERVRSLIAARVPRAAVVSKRSADAGHNELAVEVEAAEAALEGEPVVKLGQGEYERAYWGGGAGGGGRVVRHGGGA